MNFPIVTPIDLETRGAGPGWALQPFRATISAVSTHKDCLLDPSQEQLNDILTADASRLLGWNVTFDAAVLTGNGHDVMNRNWLDAMLLWRHAVIEPEGEDIPKTKRKSYSLAAAMEEFHPGEGEFKKFEDFAAMDEASIAKLLERNRKDAEYTLRLALRFWKMLSPRQRQAAMLEAQSIPMVALTHVEGLVLDVQALDSLQTKLDEDKAKALEELTNLAPEIVEYNIGSPKQLADLLFTRWGLPALKKTKVTAKGGGGTDSTDKEVLFELAATDRRARLLRDVREATNNMAKFVVAPQKSLEYNGDGRVRPLARIFGTYTSRMTYSSSTKAEVEVVGKKTTRVVKKEMPTGIALHQWKRGKEFRRVIAAPEGYTIVELDFAGQEFRWMAVASQDETMLSLCAPGEDAHAYMGAQVSQVDYKELIRQVEAGDKTAEMQRKLGKFANLSFQYRVSAKTATSKARVDYGLDVMQPFIEGILKTYKMTYPGVPRYWIGAVDQVKQKRYAETFAGRRVQLGNLTGWPMEQTAINYPIQGTGGDQKYLALAMARNHLNTFNGRLYFELHDGLFFIFPTAKAEKAGHFFLNLLSNLPYKVAWGVDFPIQFPVDGKIGLNWGDLKGFK